MLGLETDAAARTTSVEDDFARATDVAEVEAIRDTALDEIAQARRVTGAVPAVTPQRAAAEAVIREQARRRIAVLDPGAAGVPTDEASASVATGPNASTPRTPPTIGGPFGERIERNALRMGHTPGAYSRALLAAAPTALFILVPLFAVLLKLLYLFQGRLYLEHVVVGLYSHAALMLALLLVFGCTLAAHALTLHAPWAASALGALRTQLLSAMPVYLLLMRKRVYRQSWPWTVFKFLVIGSLYFALFLSVAIPMAGYTLYALD